ncbi:hypothetical protein L1987_85813 [Smallanthus sonchifolius]|uniref:Uncharacterized protein n=1 Tax=Smallanthus sonchifolius TaxID=185202 RepID=A0ACB8XXL6_9ASTR|nr:hypothetical protein L1987_85813 [Smallanthus sonchifolius]
MKLPKKLTTVYKIRKCSPQDSTVPMLSNFTSRIDIKGLQNQIISPRYHLDTASHQVHFFGFDFWVPEFLMFIE